MDITKRLKRDGQFVAVLLSDGSEAYPVFLESLHNTIILDQLLESGWQLCGLPYDLRKEGHKLESLPEENFNPTTEEEQSMYDMMSESLSMDELKSRITQAAVEYLEMPAADFKIFTREDFLNYLDSSSKISLESDFLPINYFVHPDALFTESEYLSGKFSDYINIMSRRRSFTYTKFQYFLAWAFQTGLKRDFKTIDLLDFYYQWGIDGLNMPVVSKRHEERHRVLGAGDVLLEKMYLQYIYDQEIALVDKHGTILVPENSKKFNWEPKVSSLEVFQKTYSQLGNDETMKIMVQRRTSSMSTVLEGLHTVVTYDHNTTLVGSLRLPSIQVYPKDASNRPMPTQFWSPDNYPGLRVICYLRALAQFIIEKCIVPCGATSIKALSLSGCSPYTALLYYIGKEKLDDTKKDKDPLADDDAMPVVTLFSLNKYLEGTLDNETIKEVLDNFLSGYANIDAISQGIISESEFSADGIYQELYAIHHVLGVELDDMYEQIKSISDAEEIKFSGNGYEYNLKLPKIQHRLNGYNVDMSDYRDEALTAAMEYTYVTHVAREIGSVAAKRHVALECLTMQKTPKTKILLDKLKSIYIDRVNTNVQGIQAQASWLKVADLFAAQRFFEVALKGTATIPTGIKPEVISFSRPEQMEYLNSLDTNIESTVVYCDTNVEISGEFRRYCVNAYVTPEYVIPKSKYEIPESNMLVLWRDFSVDPVTQAKLIERGLLQPGHVAWTNRYFNEKMVLGDIDANTSLLYYMRNAEDYRKNLSEFEEFVSVPHPLEYLYPALYDKEDAEISTVKLREGMPSFSPGVHRILTIQDFEYVLSTDVVDDTLSDKMTLFKGYGAEDFYMVKDVLRQQIPAGTKNITVYLPDKIYTKETGMVSYVELERLCQSGDYKITNVCGRKYLFSDIKGKLWETII